MIRKIRKVSREGMSGANRRWDALVTIDVPGYERALILRITDRGIYARGARSHKEILIEWHDLGRAINGQWGWRELLGRKNPALK